MEINRCIQPVMFNWSFCAVHRQNVIYTIYSFKVVNMDQSRGRLLFWLLSFPRTDYDTLGRVFTFSLGSINDNNNCIIENSECLPHLVASPHLIMLIPLPLVSLKSSLDDLVMVLVFPCGNKLIVGSIKNAWRIRHVTIKIKIINIVGDETVKVDRLTSFNFVGQQ